MNLLLILLILAAVWRGWREARRGLIDAAGRLISLCLSLFVLSLAILLYTSIREKDTKNIILSVIAILLTGGAAKLIHFLIKSLSGLARLPLIGLVNRVLGMAVGVLEAIVALWIVYVIIEAFDTGSFGQLIGQWTQDSEILQVLFRMNRIAYWIAEL